MGTKDKGRALFSVDANPLYKRKHNVIKYLFLKDLTILQIKEEMDSTLKDSSRSYSTVKQRKTISIASSALYKGNPEL